MLDTLLATDPAHLDAQWARVQAWVAERFGIEQAGLEAVLFLIGVQETGSGYRRLDKEAKQDAIMRGTYAVFERVGVYVRDVAAPGGWRRAVDLPEMGLEVQEKLLRVATVSYFAEYVEDLHAAQGAGR